MSDDKKARKAELKAEKKRAKANAKLAKAAAKRETAEDRRSAPGEESSGAPFRRLVGQGVFQLIVKIIAGLVVAYVLIRLGMR